MFTERSLAPAVESVREHHAPDALVLDCEADFETVPPAQAEELGLLVDELDPLTYPSEWVPPDAPDPLVQYVSGDFTIGLPGDGSVVWTTQTTPPVVLCKPRLDGAPDSFAHFLVAEALVEIGFDVPEQFLGFFREQYPDLAVAVRDVLGPADTYQLAAACYTAYVGLQSREVFADWDGELFDAWLDGGERLDGRLADLSQAVARGETSFAAAAELACSAIKHASELPQPFDALGASAYLDHGPSYAVEWADRTIHSLADA